MPNLKPFLLFLLLPVCSFGQGAAGAGGRSSGDSVEVRGTVDSFVVAFVNLDWPRFSASFAEEATAFFPPSARMPYRANNKQEVLNIFSHVFENARKQKTAPPYLVIEPKDLRIQLVGEVAIVTFILHDPDLLGRRTIVFRKMAGKWLIVHLHASGVAAP